MRYSQKMEQRLRCPEFGAMARIGSGIIVTLLFYGCGGCNQSLLLYRMPYADGTEVCVSQDHLTHSPANQVDLRGINGTGPYPVVAAQTGIVREIVDNLTQNCCGGTCGNNYVWLEHVGGEWTKYSHLATGSVTGDAGLELGEVVVAGTFLGFESDVGRACGSPTCNISNGVHNHFEVGVPNDPDDPLSTGNVGSLNGTNRIPRFCGVQGQILVQGRDETATRCASLNCIQSQESPSTEGNCQDGLDGDVCVQEVTTVNETSYTLGVDFFSSSVKIDLDWCPNANCDATVNAGRAIVVRFIVENDEIVFIANCQNRTIRETVHHVEEIVIENLQGLAEENTVCNGNQFSSAFARWELCDVPSSFAN